MIKIKTLKSLVIALTLLFAMALTLGITGAAYSANRNAGGTLSMANGIVIDYSGFGKVQDGIWEKEQTTTFKLFTDRAIVPGDTVTLNSAAIKKGTNSIDFYARIKFEYKFYDALDADITTTVGNEYTNFISTPAFNSAWVDGNAGDGWFYYATGTTLNTLPASYVNIFSSSAINVELNVAGFNHEGGGYKFTDAGSNEVTIAKVEAVLTLQALQTTGATWEIIPQYTDAAGVVYTQNNDETWTLTDGTALSGSSNSSTATYSARIYTSSYSYTVLSQINNQDVVAIGDAAFLNASQLTAVEIPTTVTSIGANAFKGTGLTEITLPESVSAVGANALASNTIATVTIENDQAVVTGIETAGIPTASTINVPGIVLNDYETSLSSYSNLAAILVPSVGLTYSYDSTTQSYTVTGIGTCADANVVIPSTYDNGVNGEHSVTTIGNSSFRNCTNLTSITIPSSIVSINVYAFRGCTGLISVTIPLSVINIGGSIFEDCTGLTQVNILNSTMGESEFSNCTNLTNIQIDNSVINISNYAFSGCTSLSSIEIPDSVTRISDYAFSGCTNLTSVTISNSVTYIGYYVFSDCTSLTSITIPNSIETIGSSTFSGCIGLTEFISNNSKYTVSSDGRCLIENDGENHNLIAFAPSGLTSYTIPNSVNSIDTSVFKNCTNLVNIVIPTSITNIAGYVFYGCTGLTSLTIPSSVIDIWDCVFQNCTGLTEVTIDSSTIANLNSSNSYLLANATTVYVLEGLTVGDYIGNWGHTTTSDKAGYVKYVKNA